MDLVEKLQKLAADVPRRQEAAIDEANTGSYLVDPLLLAFGYNPTEPDDVQKELTADVGRRRNKADYVLKQDGVEIILLEIKPVGTNLSEWVSQLDGYFRNKEDIKFAILADGINYWFFSDFDSPNVMDKEPFLILDLRKIHESIVDIVDVVGLFTKSRFHKESAVEAAHEAKDRFRVRRVVQAEVNPLSEGLVGYFIDKISPGRIPRVRREELAKHVKRAWRELIEQEIAGRLQRHSKLADEEVSASTEPVVEEPKPIPPLMPAPGSSVEIPVYAHYEGKDFSARFVVKHNYKKRNDKVILFEGTYDSPSGWAKKLRIRIHRELNMIKAAETAGWTHFWYYKDAKRKVGPIDDFRKDPALVDQYLRNRKQ